MPPIESIPWYPEQNGYQWSLEKRKVRKLPLLAEFQKWLVELSNSGSITRQEAVSMIPPLLLGVEPHHRVLDMCAAPGSKTSQLLEALHAQQRATGKTPTGMVVANDIDLKRAYMLVHQSKRIGSPALVVTCHEAQHIPFLGPEESKAEGYFDRVLCDAPCSGDGTLRKNPLIWRQWNARNGMALHPVQLDISKRGASLLQVGGYMCYSTCTFNPIENEAIVADLLRWANGSLELVDVADKLPLLQRRPGISTWKVLDSELTEYESFEKFSEANEQERKKDKVSATMFPPTTEETERFHLDRCLRCVPHDQNTGGFFICLLKKVAATPPEPEKPNNRKNWKPKCTSGEMETSTTVKSEEAAEEVTEATKEEADVAVSVEMEDASNTDSKSADSATDAKVNSEAKPPSERALRRREERKNRKTGGDEYVAFTEDQWRDVKEYYAISDDFSPSQLITRSEDAKSVTFVTKSISMPLLEEMKQRKYKVVYAGLKMFERNDNQPSGRVYRLCQAGLAHIMPFMNQRKTKVSTNEFQMMLERLGDLIDFDEFEPATRDIFAASPIGSIVCSLERPNQSSVEYVASFAVIWCALSDLTLVMVSPTTGSRL